jgi:chromosome segregation ATPase
LATDELNQLEARVVKMLELLTQVKAENEALKEEVRVARHQLEDARRAADEKDQLIQKFEDDRLRIRSRVEKIIERVDSLEQTREMQTG